MATLFGVALALLSLVGAFPSYAAPAPLEVVAPPSLERTANRLRALAHEDFSDLLTLVGLSTFGPPVRVIVAPDDSDLARLAPSWVSGYARPLLNEIVLFPDRVPSYPDRTLTVLLRHEVAHVLASRAAGHRPLPSWLAEGIATVAAREWGLEDQARYAAAVIGPGPRSFAQLEAAFSANSPQVARAYALSAALVRSLQRRYGPETVPQLLAGLSRGEDLPTAFRSATGTSLAESERRFFRTAVFWTSWLPFLTSSTALWMAITLLALVAILRRRQRDAELRARWREMETTQPSLVDSTAADPPTGDPKWYN